MGRFSDSGAFSGGFKRGVDASVNMRNARTLRMEANTARDKLDLTNRTTTRTSAMELLANHVKSITASITNGKKQDPASASGIAQLAARPLAADRRLFNTLVSRGYFSLDEVNVIFSSAEKAIQAAVTPEQSGKNKGTAKRAEAAAILNKDPSALTPVEAAKVARTYIAPHIVEQKNVGLVDVSDPNNPRVIKAAVPDDESDPDSDLVDDRNNLKNEVTAELRRGATALVAMNINQFGQAVATGEQSAMALQIATKAGEIILAFHKKGTPIGTNAALKMAAKELDFKPPEAPEFELSVEDQKKLAGQNAHIAAAKIAMRRLLSRVPKATGVGSNLAAMFDATVGQVGNMFGGGPLFEDTQDARQSLRTFAEEFKRAFIKNTRFPEGEQKRLEKLVPIPDEWFKNPATAVANFRNLYDELSMKEHFNNQMMDGRKPQIPIPQTQEDFNDLKHGELYQDPDSGEIRRKKDSGEIRRKE